MNVLSLFAGIGGFDLALERAGMTVVAQCEISAYPRSILQMQWPDVPCYEDVHSLMVDRDGNLFYINDDGSIVFNVEGGNMGRKKSTKYNDAVNLYDKGMSIADCAEFYNVTRQAMHSALKRRGCKFRSNLRYGDNNHFHRGGNHNETYPSHKRAGHMLEKAIKRGAINAKSRCECCGSTSTFSDGRSGIQAHHDDYNKPLDVRWLCQKCHHEWHKSNKSKEVEEVAKQTIDVVAGGFP